MGIKCKEQPKVLCFGELLLRYESVGNNLFDQKSGAFNVFVGGSEANVAVKLGTLGENCAFFSAVPDNTISKEVLAILEDFNVDISKMMYTGDRLGTYYLLSANGLSTGDVIYDRKYSSFSQLKKGNVDWEHIFDDVNWFHFSALTPALDDSLVDLMKEGLAYAESRDITISVDLNYRSRLWQYGKRPIEVMPELVSYAEVIMGNVWASENMLGIGLLDDIGKHSGKERLVEASELCSRQVFRNYEKCQHIANTFRFMDNDCHNSLFGVYHNRLETKFSDTMESHKIVDRIGSGDAFMAGIISGIRKGLWAQDIVDLGTQSGFDKLFVKGDF